jgi:hypothetical protein
VKWLFFGLVFLLLPSVVCAQVVVNEVYPNPQTGESEWVELYNSGSDLVELSSWQLWDEKSSASLIHQFEQDVFLEGQALLVIELQSVLNNSGDAVNLKNDQGQVVDSLAYSSAEKGISWAKNPSNFSEVFETEPTRGQANLTPSPSPTPTPNSQSFAPELSEIVACPSENSEWVELFNPHQTSINLTGFFLRDDKSQVWLFTDEQLASQDYLAIELTNVLNNSGDSVRLISPDNQLIDSFSYQDCLAEKSWIKENGTWQQTEIITKEAANIASVSNQSTSQPTASAAGEVRSAAPPAASNFIYPAGVLKPKLEHQLFDFPSRENLVFHDPPKLEKGALSVIMSSLLLLIPGWVYVKNKQQSF